MGGYQRRIRVGMVGSPGADHFVSGFERVEVIGGECVRLVPYVNREDGGHTVRAATEDCFVMPRAAMMDLAAKLIAAAGQPVTVDETGKIILMQ